MFINTVYIYIQLMSTLYTFFLNKNINLFFVHFFLILFDFLLDYFSNMYYTNNSSRGLKN